MVAKNSSVLFMIGLFFFIVQTTEAQTLIRERSNTKEIKKSWKMEWGILTGMGVSNVLRPDQEPKLTMPEGVNAYKVMYAPRPEAEIGIFGEIGKTKSIFSVMAHFSYTMRAVPEPVFYNQGDNVQEAYKSTYLNGATGGILFCFKPVEKFKIGIGVDMVNFMWTKAIEESNIGEYTENYTSSAGLKMMLSYKVSPRVDLNVYGRLGRINGSGFDVMEKSMKPDEVSAGMTVAYRIGGKEIRYKAKIEEEKKVYKLDYTK